MLSKKYRLRYLPLFYEDLDEKRIIVGYNLNKIPLSDKQTTLFCGKSKGDKQ